MPTHAQRAHTQLCNNLGVRIGFEVNSVVKAEGSIASLKVYRQGCITRAVKVTMDPELITASGR